MDAVFHFVSDCQRKALAQSMRATSSVHSRFQRCVKAGVFLRLGEVDLPKYHALKEVTWSRKR